MEAKTVISALAALAHESRLGPSICTLPATLIPLFAFLGQAIMKQPLMLLVVAGVNRSQLCYEAQA